MNSRYGDAAQRYPVLGYEQQLLLAQQVRRWLDWQGPDPCPAAIERKGRRAKGRMIETNMRLVLKIVCRYRNLWMEDQTRFDDLVSEGTVGLARAIDLFQPSKGYRFSTYATWWIRQSITRAGPLLADVIRKPDSARWETAKIARAITTYEAEHGTRPPIEELAELVGMPIQAIKRLAVIGSMRIVSLDAAIGSDDDGSGVSTWADVTADPAQNFAEELEEADLNQARAALARELLDIARPRDRIYLTRSYLHGEPLHAVSDDRGDSRARGGQLRQRGLAEIRAHVAGQHFDPDRLEQLSLPQSALLIAA